MNEVLEKVAVMDKVKLDDIIEFARNGAAIKQSEDAKGFPISRIETIWNSTIDEDRLGYANIFDEDLIKYEKYLLKKNDILITHINSPKHLGKSAIYTGYPEKLIHGMNLLCLRTNPNFSNSKYLFYYFQTKYFKNQILKISNQSVNQASFAVTNLKELEIPIPPLATQQKIAEILDKADELRQYNKQLIEKYDALTQSLFLEMFGDPVKNDKGWEKSEVINYCTCIVPGRDKPKSFTGEIPWVTTDDLIHLGKTNKSKKNIGLNNDEILNVKAKKIPLGSVIITCVGNLGVVSINEVEMIINQQLHAFQCLEKLNNVFLMHCLSYQKSYMYKMASSTTVPYMNKTICNNIPIIVPPTELQNQFTERVQLIEIQKQRAQETLAKSEELFQSLLQRAFKGELN